MAKWVLAAIAVALLSLAISAGYGHLSSRPSPPSVQAFAPGSSPQTLAEYEAVSLVRLLADPDRYDGRRVRVEGYLTLGFEDLGLHLDKAAYEGGLRANAIWLERPQWLAAEDERRLSRRYAAVAGVFDASDKGDYGLYSGTMSGIVGIGPLLTNAEFQRMRLGWSRDVLVGQFLSPWFLTLAGWMGLGLLWTVRRRR